MSGFSEYQDLLAEPGKHETGKACLYVETLADLDVGVLKQPIKKSFRQKKNG